MKLQPILTLEIYYMVVYKICLNTKVDVHIRSSNYKHERNEEVGQKVNEGVLLSSWWINEV